MSRVLRVIAVFALSALVVARADAAPRARARNRALAYFDALIRDGSLNGPALDRMIAAHGKAGRLDNPILFPSGAGELVRHETIARQLATADHTELASFLRERREGLRGATVLSEDLRHESGLDTPLHFIRIAPKGPTLTPALLTEDVWYRLPRPLEVLDRHVTQGQWMTRMGGNPSHFQLGPNFPVDSIRTRTAEFLRALDTEMPLYHHRLPTEEEWMYLASDQGTNRSQLLHRFDWAATLSHAWVMANAGGEPREVATRKPTMLANKPIYDVLGLVGDLIEDRGLRRWALGGWSGMLGPFELRRGWSSLVVPPTVPESSFGLRVVREPVRR